MESADEALAQRLQEEEYNSAKNPTSRPTDSREEDDLTLETDAPFQDLHGLFLAFNDQYFESKLSACEVRWSPRMTRCAGLCVYQSRAQYCSIRLSEPLLKFRPESDYIDTLLHEMIHAYLFVTKEIQDHDGHGADFQFHMDRINKLAGTTITIYHTFHDEVKYYLTHVWQCDGPCRSRPPYFGIVKRAMNRPPQPADTWYAEHQATCGGTYTKISEPESKKKAKKNTKQGPEPRGRTMLDNFFAPTSSTSSSSTTSSPRPSAVQDFKLKNPTLVKGEDLSDVKHAKTSGKVKVEAPNMDGLGARSLSSTSLTSLSDAPVLGTSSSTGKERLSPREAAAAAALARFERHQGATQTSTPLDTVVTTKRKTVSDKEPLAKDSDTQGTKRVKVEVSESKSLLPVSLFDFTEARTIEDIQPASKPDVPMVQCPVCSKSVQESTINDHVDLCIWRMSGVAED